MIVNVRPRKIGKYELLFRLGKSPEKTDSNVVVPEAVEIMEINSSPYLETEKATELLESLLNESAK